MAVQKNREWYEGLAAGLMLGPFGVVVMACMPTLEAKAVEVFEVDDHQVDAGKLAPAVVPRLSDAEWAKRRTGDTRRLRSQQ